MKYFFLFLLAGSCFGNIYAQNAFLVGPWDNNIKSVTASSELENRYLVQNLIDNSYRSWTEGIDGNGIGEYFTIEFKSLSKISGFIIKMVMVNWIIILKIIGLCHLNYCLMTMNMDQLLKLKTLMNLNNIV
jgi:hypothetical protein